MAVVFWEGNNGQGDGWPLSTAFTWTYDLTEPGKPVPDDEASSCTLVDVEAGTVIEVFNSSSGKVEDGYTTITVTENFSGPFIIATFEKDQAGTGFTVEHNGKGSVDGKVSLIKITAG